MELIDTLFEGSPRFWGGGVAHSVMILAIVISLGLMLGRVKVKGVTLGLTWILFCGILFAHFNLNIDVHLLHFMKEFGLILFVYSIGLQIGPGFFSSYKKGGSSLNLMAVFSVALSLVIAIILVYTTGIDVPTMAGILSGAVTNTPGLGAAQQAFSDLHGTENSSILMGYAAAYPLGVVGLVLSFLVMQFVMKVNKKTEEVEAVRGLGHLEKMTVRAFTLRVENKGLDNVTVKKLKHIIKREFVISRILCKDDQNASLDITGNSVVRTGDLINIIASPKDIDAITAFVGTVEHVDWKQLDHKHIVRHMLVTRNSMNGKSIEELDFRGNYGVNITRVLRSGIELVPTSDLKLQVGDRIVAVGEEQKLAQVEHTLGNQSRKLNDPNLIPIFLGIALGCIVANIPFWLPGIPQSLRLGLTGGPLVVAILIGHFGPRHHVVTFNTISANYMLRELGLCIFLACVGLSSGQDFLNVVFTREGLGWIGCGALITILPTLLCGFLGRYVMHFNFYTLLGMLSGANTNPPALAYTREMTATDLPSVSYSAVFPVVMFLRIVSIQLFIFILG